MNAHHTDSAYDCPDDCDCLDCLYGPGASDEAAAIRAENDDANDWKYDDL